MKKLVAVTTVILVILLAVLGVIVVRESAGDGDSGSTSLADLRESLTQLGEDGTDSETESESEDYIYDGSLLRMQAQQEVIVYEGRNFEVQFANPFYEAGSENYVSVIFYDENHGYLLRSLGTGTESEFYEAYKTEDGCQTWNKCAADVWFDLDGENHLEMISETELVYIHSVVNESLGLTETHISYSPDGGDSWYAFEGSTGDEDSEAILAAIEEMSLEEKVAQLFMVSPETLAQVETVYYAGDMTYEALETYQVCGVIYTEKNIESSDQFGNMIENMKSFADELEMPPLFLAVAEEGGEDSVLGGNDDLDAYDAYDDDDDSEDSGTDSLHGGAPSMSEIGRSGDADTAYAAGQTMAGLLENYGLNMNLAPVADVLSGNSYQMGTRSLGTDAQTVADLAVQVMLGLQDEDICAVMKYFPGYGAAAANMTGFPVLHSSLDELKAKEFLPYTTAIAQGLDFIMVGHISVPEVIGDDTPSSLSEVMITDVLRGDLGYKGIVMTDYLNDDEIQAHYSSAEAAVAAIQAGADILVEPADFREAYEGVLDAVQDGTLTEERIDESLYRILRVKQALKSEETDTGAIE